MNISGISKAKILATLYNNSKPLPSDFQPMTEEEAQELVSSGQLHFDYLKGRVLKIDLSGDELDTRLYNLDNGENAAEAIIERFWKQICIRFPTFIVKFKGLTLKFTDMVVDCDFQKSTNTFYALTIADYAHVSFYNNQRPEIEIELSHDFYNWFIDKTWEYFEEELETAAREAYFRMDEKSK